jgi:uncharacterized protein YcbK (DUF882 family)
MKFSIQELLKAGSHKWAEKDVDVIILRNIEDLCRKINALGYEPPMRATSCLRSIKDQQRINPSAMGSSHLYGCAVDIADPKGELKKWCVANKAKLIECGLWMEDPKYTTSWCHLSSYMPKSGKRIFIP